MESTVFIGREIRQETAAWLKAENICFEQHPLIRIEFVGPDMSGISSLKSLTRQFVLTSQWAAKWLVENARLIEFSKEDVVYCLSEKQKAIVNSITNKTFVSPEKNAQALAAFVLMNTRTEDVIFLHGDLALNSLPSKLKDLGPRFKTVKVYKNLPVDISVNREFDFYIFFSPSAVVSFVNSGNSVSSRSKIVAIGTTTAKICRDIFGTEVYVSEKQDELNVIKYTAALVKKYELQL